MTPQKVVARVAAGAALTMSAGNASQSLNTFASWFLGIFAAGLSIVISQLKDVSQFIPPSTIVSAAYLFLVATVIGVMQRYIATVIASGAKSGKDGRDMAEQFRDMDHEEFIAQMYQGIPWPMRKLCKSQFDALGKGDYAAVGRMFMRLVVVQGIPVTAMVTLLLIALTTVVNAIHVNPPSIP